MWEKLKGYKSYIVAVLLGITATARALGYIPDETYEIIIGFLGGAGLAALRSSKRG